MTKMEIAKLEQELCGIFDTLFIEGALNISNLMSTLSIHDLNVKFGAARRKLEAVKPDFNFNFSESVFKVMKERIYGDKKIDTRAYSLYEVVYGFILLLDCFLQLDDLEEKE